MAPLTNAPFAVVEDVNGNVIDAATAVPEVPEREIKFERN